MVYCLYLVHVNDRLILSLHI